MQLFQIGEEMIKSIQQKPVKMRGRWIKGDLTDRNTKEQVGKMFSEGMRDIGKSLVTGVMKVWIYQHMLLHRLGWVIMIYEISVSWIEKLETKANGFIRKWLGVSRCLTDVALYCKDSPCPLPISSISTEFKKRKASSLVQLQQSRDRTVSENVPALYTGRKWNVHEEVEAARSRIRLAKIGGKIQKGRSGLGYGGSVLKFQKGSAEQQERKEIADVVGVVEGEKLYVKAIQQGVQGK